MASRHSRSIASLRGRRCRGELSLEIELRDGQRTLAKAGHFVISEGARQPILRLIRLLTAPVYTTTETINDPTRHTVSLQAIEGVKLWDLENPNLYTVYVRLLQDGRVIDEDMRRIGFREATFTDLGFSINGKIVKLRGLDRHQTFPFVGQAMPARVQRQDA